MINDKRNRTNLDKLAVNTRNKAYQWYEWCVKNGYEILVYETIRTAEKQRENIKNGKSQTMKSYHLVGQALDWVCIDSKGNALWNGYNSPAAQKIIKHAKSLGFVSGYDWGWDAPHLQYEYKGYGTDTFKKAEPKKDYSKQLGYNAPKDSKVYRLHTSSYKNKDEAESKAKSLVSNKLLAYAETFGNDTDGYRIQSGKYDTQKDAEKAAINLLENKETSYVSIIGSQK